MVIITILIQFTVLQYLNYHQKDREFSELYIGGVAEFRGQYWLQYIDIFYNCLSFTGESTTRSSLYYIYYHWHNHTYETRGCMAGGNGEGDELVYRRGFMGIFALDNINDSITGNYPFHCSLN